MGTFAHAESYSVYKNGKAVAEKIKETKYIDNVAPESFMNIMSEPGIFMIWRALSQINKNKNRPFNFPL